MKYQKKNYGGHMWHIKKTNYELHHFDNRNLWIVDPIMDRIVHHHRRWKCDDDDNDDQIQVSIMFKFGIWLQFNHIESSEKK